MPSTATGAKVWPLSPEVKTIGYSRPISANSVKLIGIAFRSCAKAGISPGDSRRTFWVL